MADDNGDDPDLVSFQSPMKHLPRSPTAEYPALDARRLRLIKAFEEYNFRTLYKELYQLAKEDLEISEAEKDEHPDEYITRRKMRSASSTFVKDFEGQKYAFSLLLSIPKRITEAIIWNNFGYQYMTDESFRKLTYSTDATAGSYLNTFVIKSSKVEEVGKALTRHEWREVQRMIQRYIDGWEVIAETPEQKENAAEARKIDEAFGRRGLNQQKGERYFTNSNRELEVFYDKMLERNARELDPSGNIQQIQNPLQAGCARSLSIRMGAHDSSAGLRSSTAPWGLTLSCLEVLEFEVKLISCPIFKVWHECLYKLSEILLTSLGGTMVHDGGYNPEQPGTNIGRESSYSYKAEKAEVFDDNPYYGENLLECKKDFDDRLSTLNWYHEKLAQCPPDLVAELGPLEAIDKMCKEEIEKKLDDHIQDLSDLQAEQAEISRMIEESLQKWETRIAAAEERTKKYQVLNRQVGLYANFVKGIEGWLKDAEAVKKAKQAASAAQGPPSSPDAGQPSPLDAEQPPSPDTIRAPSSP